MSRVKHLARRMLPSRAYRVYRRWKIAREVSRYRPRIVTHVYGGTQLTIELRDPLAEGWYDRDWPMMPELERLRAAGLQPGARVLDVGAHQGIVALMLADAVGNSGHVIAVEAEPHNVRAAERNRELNGVQTLQIVHAAGAAEEGTVLFAEGLNGRVDNDGGAWGKIEVAAVTVDGLAVRYGRPDVVLLDVEGFEGDVLDGATHTIAARHATFLVEVHVNHGLKVPPERIVECFGSGYRLAVAPVEQEQDVFVSYTSGCETVRDRFFLLATPR